MSSSAALGSVRNGNASGTAVALAVVLAVLTGVLMWRREPVGARSEVELPDGVIPLPPTGINLDVSPDGSRIAFVGISLDRSTRLWQRVAEDAGFDALAGTESARNPKYSPDGRSLAFTRRGTLFTLAEGAAPEPVAEGVDGGYGIDWGPDGWIYYYRSNGGWSRVLSTGGGSERVANLAGEDKGLIDVLPEGAVLFTLNGSGGVGDHIALAWPGGEILDLGPGAMARYSASGHIVYAQWDGTLHTRTLDISNRSVGQVIGTLPVRVHVAPNSSSYFALATEATRDGTLVYLTPGAVAEHPSRLVWVDRSGNEVPIVDVAPDAFTAVAMSPDERRVAVSVASSQPTDLWLVGLDGGERVRLTAEASTDRLPTWSPDGRSLAYVAALPGRGEVRTTVADGGPPRPPIASFGRERPIVGVAPVPDGRRMVVAEVWPDRGSDLLLFDIESRTVESLVATEHDETAPAVSPDGRWLAYVSDETGGREVWVRPLSQAGAPATRVSMDGGEEPVWSKGTRELFYRDPSRGDLVAAVYGVAPVFSVTERRPLFDATVYRHEAAARAYDVDAAGERFLMMRPTADAARATTMHRMDGVVHEIRRSGSDGVPLERRLVLLALPVLLFASVMYIASRVSLGLTPVGALRQTARGFAYLGTMMLALAPIMLFANREVAGIGISAVLTGIASGALWWRGRRRIASAGDVLLSIPDVATRNFAAPSALFAMLGAVGWSFRPGMGWGGRILVLAVALVAGLLALRARSATVELRERGIVRLGHVSDWGKFEGFSWSPNAAATLVLVVRGRLPILSRYLLRVPPASRDDVVKVLGDRLGQSVAADTPRRVERAHA